MYPIVCHSRTRIRLIHYVFPNADEKRLRHVRQRDARTPPHPEIPIPNTMKERDEADLKACDSDKLSLS